MESEMARTHHLSMTGAVIVCLVSTQGNGMLFASDDECSWREAPSSPSLTDSTSETQMSTSGGLAPAISIDEHPAGTDLSLTPLPQMERSRFTLNAGFLTANPSLGPVAQGAHRPFNLEPTQSSAFAGQIYQGRPYRMGRDGSIAAIMIGAVAAITGAAILVYANRPECDTHQFAGGCGYGTKVVGGAVLSGGVVGLFVGALTWR
jgi:hypothetical protein